MLEVITGPMFSGKTEEMLRRLRREQIAGNNVLVIRPSIDRRYSEDEIISHSGYKMYASSAYDLNELQQLLWGTDTQVFGIDEGQFFPEWLIDEVWLRSASKKIIVTGLDTNFRNEPFTIIPHLMAIADKVDKLTAVCHTCGGEATRTQRLIDGLPASRKSPEILVGGLESYEARCRVCHEI
jgi:thymidine kinase